MINTVFDLLDEIYSCNFDELPEKIKINGNIFKLSGLDNYVSEKDDVYLLQYLAEFNTYDSLSLSVGEVKENKLEFEFDDRYWSVNSDGEVFRAWWQNTFTDNFCLNTNNCFRTKKEAEQYKENIKTGMELRELANKLNKNEKFDWEDDYQKKYYMFYDNSNKMICQTWNTSMKYGGLIYCLSENFKEKALEQIGEEKLINYLKEV